MEPTAGLSRLKRICVFCGSRRGRRPEYVAAARAVGATLGRRGIGLVYGGGGVGVMGELADAALAHDGEVIGVIPHSLLEWEVGHTRIADLRVVDTMHERKALMASLSDAFIALPGGYGTLEELFEVLTWAQLGLHPKPCGLLNVGGYFDPLLRLVEHMVEEGFLRDEHRSLLLDDTDVEALLARLSAYEPPVIVRRLKLDEI